MRWYLIGIKLHIDYCWARLLWQVPRLPGRLVDMTLKHIRSS